MRFELKTIQENLRRLGLLVQRKGAEELKAKQEVKSKREHRVNCLKTRDEASYWASKCYEFEQKRLRIRQRVFQVGTHLCTHSLP